MKWKRNMKQYGLNLVAHLTLSAGVNHELFHVITNEKPLQARYFPVRYFSEGDFSVLMFRSVFTIN